MHARTARRCAFKAPPTANSAALFLLRGRFSLPFFFSSLPLHGRTVPAMVPCTADGEAPGRRAKRARPAADPGAAGAPAAAAGAGADADAVLLAMSPGEIDAYIAQAQRTAALPRAEVRRLRQLRRMVRNREYARLSRDRRVEHAARVERELAAARDENRALRERVAALAARVAELERLRGSGGPVAAPPAPEAVAPRAAPEALAPRPRPDGEGGSGATAGTPHQDLSPTTTAEVAASVPHGIGTTCLL